MFITEQGFLFDYDMFLKKRVFIVLLLAVTLFLLACSPKEPAPDPELEAKFAELSDEELLDIMTAEKQAAVAGQASYGVDSDAFKPSAEKVLRERLEQLKAGHTMNLKSPQAQAFKKGLAQTLSTNGDLTFIIGNGGQYIIKMGNTEYILGDGGAAIVGDGGRYTSR